ncbi:Protein phosphatase [Globisporangium polare]
MADKRRKRKTDAPASSYEDGASSKDFHAVDISDPSAMPRRRSYANSSGSSSARGESWMTKVTAAMSHRIFSGKKLGASRSTQVMPLAGATTTTAGGADGQDTRHQDTSLSSSSSSSTKGTSTSGPGQKTQTLRQVSSENSLARTTTADIGAQPTSTPVERVDFCPSVVCDIAPDDEDAQVPVKTQQQPVLQSIQVRGSRHQQQRNTSNAVMVIEKIVPRRVHGDNDSDFEAEDMSPRQRRHHPNNTKSSMVMTLDRESRYAEDSTPVIVQDTAPILKDFFSRNASTGQGLRVQQRESRRESLYKTSRQRQERLRKRVEDESHESEAQLRKLRAEQLQKLDQQRRLQLRQEAASAHKDLSSRLAGDQESFAKERERWECELESEIRTLSRAFRKANAKTQSTAAEEDYEEGSGGGARPMTVAGLAVPQALAQIRRDASNYEKRLKTAAPRSSRREWDFARDGGGRRKDASHQRRGSSGGRSCDIFSLEGSKDDEDGNGVEEDTFEVLYATEDVLEDEDDSRRSVESRVTIDELLDERASLLQRIAQLEKLVESQQLTAEATAQQ